MRRPLPFQGGRAGGGFPGAGAGTGVKRRGLGTRWKKDKTAYVPTRQEGMRWKDSVGVPSPPPEQVRERHVGGVLRKTAGWRGACRGRAMPYACIPATIPAFHAFSRIAVTRLEIRAPPITFSGWPGGGWVPRRGHGSKAADWVHGGRKTKRRMPPRGRKGGGGRKAPAAPPEQVRGTARGRCVAGDGRLAGRLPRPCSTEIQAQLQMRRFRCPQLRCANLKFKGGCNAA